MGKPIHIGPAETLIAQLATQIYCANMQVLKGEYNVDEVISDSVLEAFDIIRASCQANEDREITVVD